MHGLSFVEEAIAADFEDQASELGEKGLNVAVEASNALLAIHVVFGVEGEHLKGELQ
jgi:hypothetical protein